MSIVNVEPPATHGSIVSPEARELPDKALELLDAARQILDRDGADGLTLRALAVEGGVPSSLAIYYFGSMARLEAQLLDSIWRDEVAQHIRDLEELPPSIAERVDILINFHSTIARDLDGFRAYCELITHVIRDDITRSNVARLYEGYRVDLNYPFLVTGRLSQARSQANAAVMLAAGEGLPLGRLLGVSEASMLAGFDLLSSLFKRELLGEWEGTEPGTKPNLGDDVLHFDVVPLRANTHDNNLTSSRLLAGGKRLLHKGGIRELTYGNIATETGESKSLISYYFKSKKGYLEALVRVLIQEWSESVTRALIDQEHISPASLERELFGANSPLVSLILLQPVLRRERDLQHIAKSAYLHTIAVLSDRFKQRDSADYSSTIAASLFIATLNGLALQSLYDPKGFKIKSALQALMRLLPLS